MNSKELKLLILDDDPIYRRLSTSILSESFEVFTADRPSSAFEILKKTDIDYVICDYRLPEMDGLDVLERVKAKYPDVEVIMISDSGDMDTVIDAMRRGAVDYFRKPFSPSDIWMSVEKLKKLSILKKQFQNEKNKKNSLQKIVNQEMGLEMIGNSKTISDIKNQMAMVAQTPDTSVLILGESGTGKELVARGIHNMSARKNEFFGAVNMSAIPEDLFESEFFGHRKGSFTGAISDKAGWFETADKGTVFLDEIGEMSLQLQVKLLRVLEDRTFTKIGTQKSINFDIRLVAATNKAIDVLLGNKEFRTDLFHRIGTFIIQLPPLRERKSDLPMLIEYFTEFYAHKLNKPTPVVNPSVLKLLEQYHFPGNIRELRNIIERAVILCADDEMNTDSIMILSKVNNMANNSVVSFDTLDLNEIEKQTIMKALDLSNNNISEAAKMLNIEWNALYRRIQKYGFKTKM